MPNTRILKNDFQAIRTSGVMNAPSKKAKLKRPMSINVGEKKLRTPRVGAANNNSLVHAGDVELDESHVEIKKENIQHRVRAGSNQNLNYRRNTVFTS